MAGFEAQRKILFVSPSAYIVGGLATWLEYLVPGLERCGWEVAVALASGSHHDAARYRAESELGRVIELSSPTGSREGRVRSVVRVLLDQRPDLVVSVNIPDSLEAVARLRSRNRFDGVAAMAIHGIQPRLLDDCRTWAPFLSGVACTNRLVCGLATVDAGLEPDRVHYAPAGVDLPSTSSSRVERPERLRIAFVGRLESFYKRIFDIPRILGELEKLGTDFELLLAGSGPDERQLRRELELAVPASRVRFLGPLPSSEIAERVYRAADVLLLTSFSETGPLVVWEAMAHRVAVVSSRFIGSGLEAALADDVNSLLFPVGDARAAATQLHRAADPELRARLADAAYRLVADRYSIERSVSSWAAAFEDILSAPPRQGPEPGTPPASGRLDRIFGPSLGETIRRLIGRSFPHRDPGGEWPHSYGTRELDDAVFWRLAEELDTAAEGAG